jgi:hypothetical protein
MFVSRGSTVLSSSRNIPDYIGENPKGGRASRRSVKTTLFSVAPQSEENEEPDWDCPCESGAVYQALSGRDQLLHQVTPQPMN